MDTAVRIVAWYGRLTTACAAHATSSGEIYALDTITPYRVVCFDLGWEVEFVGKSRGYGRVGLCGVDVCYGWTMEGSLELLMGCMHAWTDYYLGGDKCGR